MLRNFTLPLSFLFTILLSTSAWAQPFQGLGRAHLSGQQQVLPVVTPATGDVQVNLLPGLNGDFVIVVTGSFRGLSSPVATDIGGGAHIHSALAGQNGDIIQGLVPTLDEDSLGGTFLAVNNTFTISADDVENVGPGGLYVNIHTRNHPSGELRGTIFPANREVYYANLFGSNEVPSVISPARGAVYLEVDPSDSTLVVTGSFRGLSTELAVGTHLHIALPGRNGPIAIGLDPTTPEDDLSGEWRSEDNVYTLTGEQITALRQGRFYANVHSEKFPAGEIRGQVLPFADQLLRAHLSGSNEWPVVTTRAFGEVLGHLAGDSLRVIGSFNDLSAPVATSIAGGAHLHTGWAGENGPVIIPLNINLMDDSLAGNFALSDTVYALAEDQRTQLLDRGIYLNIHSENHPPGEIRGQMLPEAQAVFTAFLNGNQQIPPVVGSGRGMVKVEHMGNRMTATGSFTELTSDLNTSIAGGAHLHAGYPGQSGPIIFPLEVDAMGDDGRSGRFLPDSNTFQVGNGLVDTLTRRFLYTNIHTLDHPGGEIRGSVLAEAESYFLAPLSGASQPDGVPTDATGMVAVEVRDTMVTLVGSFQELDSDFAEDVGGGMHIHEGIAGSNGGILSPINTEMDDDDRSGVVLADSNVVALTPDQLTDMLERELYINVHTEDNRAGAIRGQILPLAGSYFHTTLSGVNSVDYVMTTAQGGLKLELIDSMLMVSGSVTMLDGDFDASIMGGAHLHFGSASQTGPITIPLTADPGDDLKSATFSVDSNTYMLNTDQLRALRNDSLYANIHTTRVPSGEARGQILSEINLFPTMSMIQSPMDGDSILIEQDSTQTFAATFSSATDPNGDSVVYAWQLAADENFETIIFAANTGTDSTFVTDFATVYQLLSDNGVDEDQSITLYHRALASDGSNHRPGPGSEVVLTRAVIVGVNTYQPQGFAVSVFPSPAQAGIPVTYNLTTGEAFRGQLRMISALGQVVRDRTIEAHVGTQGIQLPTDGLRAGTYFINLINDDGRLVSTSRVVLR